MDTTTTRTNAAPRRRRPGLSRRASMSSLPTKSQVDAAGGDLSLMTTKETLKAQYEAQRKAVKQAHKAAKKEVEKQMQEAASMATQTFASDTMYDDDGNTSNAYGYGGSSSKEKDTSKIKLETFSMPKVSRRQRRASLGITLRILTPPQSPMVNLEDIDTTVNINTAAVCSLPLNNDATADSTSRGGAAGLDRRAMMARCLSCDMAESLAGWKTVDFPAGQPMGLQLEPTVNDSKGARVTGFLDEDGDVANDGDLHMARDEYKVELDDIIVKVNGKLVKTFDEAVKVLKAQAHEERSVTFRPAFIYEVSGGASLLDKGRKSKKSSSSKKGSLGSSGHHRGGKKKRPKKVDQKAEEETADDAADDGAAADSIDVVEQQQEEKEQDNKAANSAKPKLQVAAFVPGVTTGAAIVPKEEEEEEGDDIEDGKVADKKKKKKSSSKSSSSSNSSHHKSKKKSSSSRKLKVDKEADEEDEDNENTKGDGNNASEVVSADDASSNSEKEKWPVIQM